jgi:hypothetical protein
MRMAAAITKLTPATAGWWSCWPKRGAPVAFTETHEACLSRDLPASTGQHLRGSAEPLISTETPPNPNRAAKP